MAEILSSGPVLDTLPQTPLEAFTVDALREETAGEAFALFCEHCVARGVRGFSPHDAFNDPPIVVSPPTLDEDAPKEKEEDDREKKKADNQFFQHKKKRRQLRHGIK